MKLALILLAATLASSVSAVVVTQVLQPPPANAAQAAKILAVRDAQVAQQLAALNKTLATMTTQVGDTTRFNSLLYMTRAICERLDPQGIGTCLNRGG